MSASIAMERDVPAPRRLLYIKSGESPDLVPWARLPGWKVLKISCAHLLELRDLSEFKLLLMLFRTPADFTGNELATVFQATSAMQRLAVVQPGCLKQVDFRRLLADRFYDYYTLPLDLERLPTTLGHAYGMAQLRDAQLALQEQMVAPEDDMILASGIIGKSCAIQTFYHTLRKAAGVDMPVLLTGETGTGKERAALTVHRWSDRAKGPFVTVNCATLPDSLIQSELFGHEKGAFTGALKQNIGQIEAAHKGTVFLDEIGDLPVELQVNLLRFLEDKTILRLGSCQKIHVDARVIAATHQNLEEAMVVGRFRQDLYYRLNVLALKAPPLRERDGDVELLAEYIFNQLSIGNEKSARVVGFSLEAMDAMRNYYWPGNIRELLNRIRRAAVMSDNRLITSADLGLQTQVTQECRLTLDEARNKAEIAAIQDSLRSNHYHVMQAAEKLGISRGTLYRLMEKHTIGIK